MKLLGVHLDSKLNFENHISHICKKAGNHLNVLKRLSKFKNKNDRMAIFRAFILCHFQFCSVVLHFCGLGSMTKMDKIQERALRFVHGDYTSDYNGLLSISKLPSLKLGRDRSIVTLTYKIMHNLAPSYLKDLIILTRNAKLLLPYFKSTRHGLNSFMYKAPKKYKKKFKAPKKSEIVVFPGRILPCKQNKSAIFSTLHRIFPRIRR